MTKRNRKDAAPAFEGNTIGMATELAFPEAGASVPNAGGDAAVLDELMADLTSTEAGSGEVLELGDEDTGAVQPEVTAAGAIEEHPAELIDEAVADAERREQRQALYEQQGGEQTVVEGEVPQTEPEVITDPKAAKKAAAEAKRKTREAEREAKRAAKAAQPKRPTSVTHKPGALLVAKLGEGYRDYLTFDVRDAELDTLALEAKQNEFVERMNDKDAIADKVREKIIMLLTWLKAGAPDSLNEVLRRTFVVLHDKGELTSGDKGNLQLNLLTKPYSIGTARSQANQMFMALPELGITVKEKGKMVANPNSALLPMIYAKLGLGA